MVHPRCAKAEAPDGDGQDDADIGRQEERSSRRARIVVLLPEKAGRQPDMELRPAEEGPQQVPHEDRTDGGRGSLGARYDGVYYSLPGGEGQALLQGNGSRAVDESDGGARTERVLVHPEGELAADPPGDLPPELPGVEPLYKRGVPAVPVQREETAVFEADVLGAVFGLEAVPFLTTGIHAGE